jgi:hypothetical protein
MPIAAHNANLMLRLTPDSYGDLANVRNGWAADIRCSKCIRSRPRSCAAPFDILHA